MSNCFAYKLDFEERFDDISLIYFNANGILSKRTQLEYIIETESPKIVAVVETKLDKYVADSSLFPMNKYSVVRKDRSRHGGGVMIAASCGVRMLPVNECLTMQSEVISVDIYLSQFEFRLVLVYHPPNSDNMLQVLLDELVVLIANRSNCICVGDFNIPNVQWNTLVAPTRAQTNFVTTMQGFGFSQLIEEPTRFGPPNILDLLFVSNVGLLSAYRVSSPVGTSDHCSIRATIRGHNIKPKSLLWDFRRSDFVSIRAVLGAIDWHMLLFGSVGVVSGVNLDAMYESFCSVLLQIIYAFVPYFFVNETERPWPGYIRRLMQRRDSLFKTYTRDCSMIAKFEYDRLNFSINKLQHEFLVKRELGLLRNASQKRFFSYVNGKIKGRMELPAFRNSNGMVLLTDAEKAIYFNDHFLHVCKDEVFPLPNNFSPYKFTEARLTSVVVDYTVIAKYVKSKFRLSAIAGPDKLPAFFFRYFADELVGPLCLMYDFSLHYGIVPEAWKSSNVTVLYKKRGAKDNPDNYRDVSILSNAVKPLEYLVNLKIINFCLINNIISENQHGFLKYRSTSTNMLRCVFDWHRAVDRGEFVDIIYIDYRKAFNTIPHQRLLLKLRGVGIGGSLLTWISSYLSSRRQRVKISSSFSNFGTVKSGVPQGSILGPTLFLLYVNDLPLYITNSQLVLYADDSKLFVALPRGASSVGLQKDLDSLYRWSSTWGLEISSAKCVILSLGYTNPRFPFYINNVEIQRRDLVKDLGIYVNSNLKFTEHIAHIVQNGYYMVSLLLRNFACNDPVILCRLYVLYVRPSLLYLSEVWNPISVGDIDALERVQAFFTKRICHNDFSYPQRLEMLDLDSLELMRLKWDLVCVYKIINNHTILKKDDYFTLDHGASTRGHSFKLFLPRVNMSLTRQDFFVRVIHAWNHLDQSVVSASTVTQFKTRLERWKYSLSGFLRGNLL